MPVNKKLRSSSKAPPRRSGDRTLAGRPRSAAITKDRRPRALWLSVTLAALVLLLTMDDRYAGAIPDGRQMAWTAIAIAETGEIGQARGRDFSWPRTQGDAVSRYGIGMSLAQLPAAWLAPTIEARLGPGTSQPLFLIAPLLFVCVAAAAAGWVAMNLGTAGAVALVVLLTALGSPLGAYAALDLSEPLQAAALTGAAACALASAQAEVARRRSLFYAASAGFAAGIALLTKSSLIVTIPFVLVPVLAPLSATSRGRRLAWATAGLTLPVAVWIYFEFARFGRLFASYAGESFTHPFLDGIWRLIVGANRGVLLYVPVLLVSVAAAILSTRSARQHILLMTAALGTFTTLLALAAPWWAWHGLWGWGPRLLVPAVPLVIAASGVVLGRWPPLARHALLAVSVALNLPGLLQNAAPVTVFMSSCAWPSSDARVAQSLAAYAHRQEPDGSYRIAPDQALETVASASPFRVYPWFARASAMPDAATALAAPPWLAARLDISCRGIADDVVVSLRRRPGWPVWGRSFWPDRGAPGFPGVYDEGLLDQVVRAQQLGRPAQALLLAQQLATLGPPGEADAYVLESLRLLRRRPEAVEYLSGLSRERRSQPRINLVLALFERDAGNDTMARNLLGTAAAFFPNTPAPRALTAPLDQWPRDLDALTAAPNDQAGALALPSERR